MRLLHMYLGMAAALIIVVAGVFSGQQANAQEQRTANSAEAFSEAVVQQLMAVVRDGLVAHDPDKMLRAFGGMRDYDGFAEQLRTFFSLYENFRVYYRILEPTPIECVGDDKTARIRCRAVVEMQVQGDDAHNTMPGVTRSGQLHLTFTHLPNGWCISDINREFFR